MAGELSRSLSSRRSWTGSFRDASDVFRREGAPEGGRDEENLKWAALEKLHPTAAVDIDDGGGGVDFRRLGVGERRALMENVLKTVEEDNERFLRRLRRRIDRVGLELPQIEVRYENLSVDADVYVGSRALPTLWNATLNAIESLIVVMRLSSSKLRKLKILNDVTGILKPKRYAIQKEYLDLTLDYQRTLRMTLLLGPPASGKTTFLLALSGKLDHNLSVSGKVTYCGQELHEFVPQRTSAYISQLDTHNGEMTVRETFDFAARCLGVGYRYDMLAELWRREKDAGIEPDPEIDAYMKATSMEGQKCSMATDYILKVLGLDVCADILVGDEMRKGISGGQKKRVTIGEMLAGPARPLFMDEISTGLDSATTFQIVKFIRQMVHVFDATVVISLLQPAPETFELFDDIILLSQGQIVYQGPRETAVEFFESVGFKCPKRKAVADFLQEVTSKKDQEKYWFRRDQPYQHISVPQFVRLFRSFHISKQILENLQVPYDRSKAHHAALSREKYGISSWELLKACLSREWLLMKRNAFIHIFKAIQITFLSMIAMTVFLKTEMPHQTILDGTKYLGALFYLLTSMMFNGMSELALTIYKLPVFYKQRDFLFFPPWAFGLSYWLLRIPSSLFESGIMILLTYYVMGFAPSLERFFSQFLVLFLVHQMALSLFRFVAALSRTMVMSNVYGSFALLVVFVLGGFLISKDDIQWWWIWGYWSSPMTYGLNSLAVNEFLDPRWGTPNYAANINATTVGQAILKSRGMFVKSSWYWIGVGALVASCVLLNALFILALTYLNPIGSFQTIIIDEDELIKKQYKSSSGEGRVLKLTDDLRRSDVPDVVGPTSGCPSRRGMVLPFQPLSIAFNHVNYYVDMPAQMKNQGIEKDHLQLLCDVSGAFRPGVLTALVGVSGAGKTTLMDVLAGRKTSGYIEGSISISGYPKKQETFVRISGYCEQDDIHSPHVTVHESLIYSAWLRLAPTIDRETMMMFVDEVMELVELSTLRDALVGLPGIDGLSTEQRKRLTIAVELVANPSIIFMDEPTSGLDARAAAIVMRTVRKTVDTGRTVVCTIHQPSIDIFESFDELLLMKIGGQVIYSGPLGHHSVKLIEYFEAIPGVPKITEGYNPATWVLDISSPSSEAKLNLDFAKVYSQSVLYQENQQLIAELSVPSENSRDLHFATKYSKRFSTQCMACIWKQYWSYWRNPQYNAVRFFMTVLIGLLFGTIYWQKGQKTNTQQDLLNLLGAIYAAVYFMGVSTSASMQPVVAIERTVFYREKAAGMYSPMAYAIAQVVVEMAYMLIQGLLYSLILFSLIGLTWRIDNFLWFFFFLSMSFAYLALYGMMVVGLTPSHQVAGIVSSFFYTFWNLFSGFLIARPAIPVWWRWCYWADPVSWTIYGVLASQLGNRENLVEIPGGPSLTVKAFMKDILGYDRDFLGYVVLVHFCFVFVFFFAFAYSIKYINFQKR